MPLVAADSTIWPTKLPEPFPNQPKIWTDPITKLKIPKEPDANLRWRVALLEKAENDAVLQGELKAMCKESILFWLNAFGYTFKKQEAGDWGVRRCKYPDVPFVTWAVQDDYLKELHRCMIEGESLLTDKSREMGASWCLIAAIHHVWMFYSKMDILELSRVEMLVDGAGRKDADSISDINSLFGKHDYLHSFQPDWMKPRRDRSFKRMINLDNGSSVTGEATTAFAGTGKRCDVVLLDEMAKMNNGDAVKQSLMSVSPCLLPNSTPWGAGTAYTRWRQSGSIRVFLLPWWEHPEKGEGRELEKKEDGTDRVTSPWYRAMCDKMDPREVAVEIDMDHVGSGSTFFEQGAIAKYKTLYVTQPKKAFQIGFKKGTANDEIKLILRRREYNRIWWQQSGRGQLKTWCELINGRPDQTKTYGIGVDISKGQQASNSVASVTCKQTREKIAELAIATEAPHDFVRTVAALALWVGGASRNHLPMIAFESNGDPGIVFGNMLAKDFAYPLCWMDANKKPGWHSDTAKKEELLGMYRRALAHGGFINHSGIAVDEAAMYVYYSSGGVGPATLEMEDSSAKKTHGDRVIADALSLLAIGEAPRPAKKTIGIPKYSFAWFEKQRNEKKKKQKQKKPYHRW